MAFLTSLDAFLDAAVTPGSDSSSTQRGLDLAVGTIEAVIRSIEIERENLDPDSFEHRGHISGRSFGGADRAAALALHHTRAHAVTADTLKGVIEDLRTFQQACRDTLQAISDVDLDAADRLRRTQLAVQTLAAGAGGGEGDRSYRQAQYDHQHDTPTDEPPAEEES